MPDLSVDKSGRACLPLGRRVSASAQAGAARLPAAVQAGPLSPCACAPGDGPGRGSTGASLIRSEGGTILKRGSLNFPSAEVPHTRITEYRHLTGQEHTSSSMHYEYPRSEGDPYYPSPTDETRALYRRYEELAEALPDVTFVGRLARYQYLNMDQVVGQALSVFSKLVESGRLAVAS